MRTKRAGKKFHEPSLVPLADMLTNTVGIVLFILVFTVLTTGGVVLAKRLPMEQSTEKKPLMVVCAGGQVFPKAEDLEDRFFKPLGQPTQWSINSWLEGLKKHKLEDKYFVLTGEASDGILGMVNATLICTPQANRGEAVTRLPHQDSDYQRLLREHSPEKWFVYYLVRPDSMEAFAVARNLAMQQFGYSVGWNPLGPRDPVRFSLTGGGRTPGIQ